jgi:hypothetical protein
MKPPFVMLCALLSLAACASDDDEAATKSKTYLGSHLIALGDGTPNTCTNYYGDVSDDEQKALPINRDQLCPVENALGACELSAAASQPVTQTEVVYYAAGDSHASLEDGDTCDGNGTWRTPYPPQSGIDIGEGGY